MALFGRKTVIASVGISCQTAHQIDRAAPMLAEVMDEVFLPATTPFDTRIVGPLDVGGMLMENNPYPASAAELEGTKRPYWPRRKCHFWHDGAGNFAEFTAKQAHLWANWGRISAFDRKIFVLSNTQNNLAAKAKDPGGFDFMVDALDLALLAGTLARLFKRPELHVVTRKPLVRNLDRLKDLMAGVRGVRLGLHFVEPDSSQWHGDNHVWDGTLRAIIRTVT